MTELGADYGLSCVDQMEEGHPLRQVAEWAARRRGGEVSQYTYGDCLAILAHIAMNHMPLLLEAESDRLDAGRSQGVA